MTREPLVHTCTVLGDVGKAPDQKHKTAGHPPSKTVAPTGGWFAQSQTFKREVGIGKGAGIGVGRGEDSGRGGPL